MISGDPNEIFRLLYRSRSNLIGFDASIEAEVSSILSKSAEKNKRDMVTGAMMFIASIFVQALEGPREVLEQTFERICCDLRHTDIQLIEFTLVSERAFGELSLHRVRADTSVEALFAQIGSSSLGSIESAHAAEHAVTLMATLIKLEQPTAPTSSSLAA